MLVRLLSTTHPLTAWPRLQAGQLFAARARTVTYAEAESGDWRSQRGVSFCLWSQTWLSRSPLPCTPDLRVATDSEVKSLSRVRLFATPWTVAYQASPSMAFSRQEYWSGLPFPSPGDFPDPGIEPVSPALEADALTSEPDSKSPLLPHRRRGACLLV